MLSPPQGFALICARFKFPSLASTVHFLMVICIKSAWYSRVMAPEFVAPIIRPVPPVDRCTGRNRCNTWLATAAGDSISIDDLVGGKVWRCGVLMSHPLHPSHLFLHHKKKSICLTLVKIFKRLEIHFREDVFLTDIFPYVGHSSFIGASHSQNEDQQVARNKQAYLALSARPLVLLVSGAAARDAIHRVVQERMSLNQWETKDSTKVLGVPSCWVTIGTVTTLVLFQPHPSLDRFPKYGPVFSRRADIVKSILNKNGMLPSCNVILDGSDDDSGYAISDTDTYSDCHLDSPSDIEVCPDNISSTDIVSAGGKHIKNEAIDDMTSMFSSLAVHPSPGVGGVSDTLGTIVNNCATPVLPAACASKGHGYDFPTRTDKSFDRTPSRTVYLAPKSAGSSNGKTKKKSFHCHRTCPRLRTGSYEVDQSVADKNGHTECASCYGHNSN